MKLNKGLIIIGLALMVLFSTVGYDSSISADNSLDNGQPHVDPLENIFIKKDVLSESAGPFTIGSQVDYRVTLENRSGEPSAELWLMDKEEPYTGRLHFIKCKASTPGTEPNECTDAPDGTPDIRWVGVISPGEIVTILYTGEILESDNTDPIINVATIRFLGAGENTGKSDSAEIEVEKPPSPPPASLDKIRIDKKLVSEPPFTIGDSVSYRVTLANDADLDSAKLLFTDVEKSGSGRLAFSGCTIYPASEECILSPNALQLRWEGVILANGSVTIEYTAQLREGTMSDTSSPVVNFATVSLFDDDSEKKSAEEVTISLTNPDPPSLAGITIKKEILSTAPYEVGDLLEHRVTVKNDAEGPSAELKLIDREDSNAGRLKFSDCEVNIDSEKCTVSSKGSQIQWNGVIPAESSIVFTYLAEILTSDISDMVPIFNVATVSLEEGGTEDSMVDIQRIIISPPLYFPITFLGEQFPRLVNGGFDEGPDKGWAQQDNGTSSPSLPFIVFKDDPALGSVEPYEGDWLAWLGGINQTTVYTLTQTLETRSDDIDLIFFQRVGSRDSDCTVNPDRAFVYVNSELADERVLCASENSDWGLPTQLPLADYLASTNTLQIDFVVRLNSQDTLDHNSNWFLDSVAICTDRESPSWDAVACPK